MKKLLFVFAILITLLSCGPRFIYPHLEWLIPWYVGDYISLDRNQKSMLQERLLNQLDWHCRTQLPAYAETLRAIRQEFTDAEQPISYTTIQFYRSKLLQLWKGLMKQIGPDIYDILLTASDAQVDELFENLSKRNQELKKEYVDISSQELMRKRQNRARERLKYWISELTAEQEEIVSSWSARLTPLSEEWIHNRATIQAEARRLLADRNGSPEFRANLMKLIVNYDQMRTPAYQAKIDANTDITIKFIIRLNQTITPGQRSSLLDRLETLAKDFDALSCDPRHVPRPKAWNGNEN